MTTHLTGTRKEWLSAPLELLEAEKELTRRSDELARRRQELPRVRIDKESRFEARKGVPRWQISSERRSQLLVYHFMFGPDYTAGCPSCSAIADGFQDGRLVAPPRRVRQSVSDVMAVIAQPSQRCFFGVSALLFAVSAALTIGWCASMSAMGNMPMPGGWTMSMAWMRMPGQTWLGAAASFLGMWVVMMIAMMLPSLVPLLWRYRSAVAMTGERRLAAPTALVGVGYFFVWTAFGMAAFPFGVALTMVEMQQPTLARCVPIAVGVVVLIAGALQLSAWKARHLACCREAPGRGGPLPADAGTAWRHGVRLGLHCCYCCAGLMTILLVIGVVDLRTMGVVTAAITVERLAPAGERVARAIGAVVVGGGLILIARAAGLG